MSMRRLSCVLACAAVALVAAGSARAQESKVEIDLGMQYPLLSQKMYMEQSLGFNLRAGVRLSQKWTLLGLYEKQSAKSTVPDYGPDAPQGDVTVEYYGLEGVVALKGEPEFQVLGILGIGKGRLAFDNPNPPIEGKVNGTDIKLWYEAGFGVQWKFTRALSVRLQVTGRQTEPSEPSVVLPGTRFSIVPALDAVIRF